MTVRKEGLGRNRRAVLWVATSLVGLGCANSKPSNPAPSGLAAPTESPAPAAADSASAVEIVGEVPAGSLRLAWSSDTQSWNRIVAIAPSGDVVSVGSGKIHVHARDTGKVMESADVCYVKSRRGFAFVTQARAVLACTDGLFEVTFPGLATRVVTKTDGLTTAVVVSKDAVAYALRGGAVHVLSTDGYGTRDRFSADGEVEELLFSPDGRFLAVGRRDGMVMLRDLGEHTVRTLGKGERRATGLAFTADGRQLFVNNETFGARVLDTTAGTLVRHHRAGPWISTAAGLGRGWFVAAGSDGLVIYRDDAEKGSRIESGPLGPTSSCEGLDVSADGTFLCTGDRQGRVVCFTTRAVAPTRYVAVGGSKGRAEGGSGQSSAAAPETQSIEGTVESRAGKELRVRVSAREGLEPGVEASLFRRFEQKIGTVEATGWLLIARVKVTRIEGTTVVVTVESEQSPIRVGDEVVDHYQPNTRVKIEWSRGR
jgi:WD domain, G-beta repeat